LLETANAAHLVFVCISAAKSREVTVILNREILQAQCSSAAHRLNTISTPTGNHEQDGGLLQLLQQQHAQQRNLQALTESLLLLLC
jgi:hypothetical protein